MPQVDRFHVEELVPHAFLVRIQQHPVEVFVNLRRWVLHQELHAEDELAVNFALFAFRLSARSELLAAAGRLAFGAHRQDDLAWVLRVDPEGAETHVELVFLLLHFRKFGFKVQE